MPHSDDRYFDLLESTYAGCDEREMRPNRIGKKAKEKIDDTSQVDLPLPHTHFLARSCRPLPPAQELAQCHVLCQVHFDFPALGEKK